MILEIDYDQFLEHMEAAGAEIAYTQHAIEYWKTNYVGKNVLAGTYNRDTNVAELCLV